MHPVLIRFSDSFYLGTYGVLVALGLLLGNMLAAWQGRRRGFASEVFYDLTFIAVFSGFVGARIFFIFTDIPGFLNDPWAYILSRSGFVFLGGFIAASGACSWYIVRKKLDFWKVADIAVPALALAHGFGRVGCHFAGCCFGGLCQLPIGLRVPRIVEPSGNLYYNAFYGQVESGQISDPTAVYSLPVWPVQLMEALSLFALVAVLVWLAERPRPKGLIFGIYLLAYSVVRFGLEFLRGDEERGLYFGGLVSTSQILSVVLFAAGILVLTKVRGNERYAPLAAGEDRGKGELEKSPAGRRRRKTPAGRT